MAPPRTPATSAKRAAPPNPSSAPPNPSSAPPAADDRSKLLLCAAHEGDLRLLKRLVRALDEGRGRPREAVEAAKEGGVGALHFAARSGMLPVCRYLVEELGVDVDAVDDKALTPLVWAMFGGSLDAFGYLLDHGANPALVDDQGFAPLHHAAGRGTSLPAHTIFLPYNKRVPGADSPLLGAITVSSVKCVKLLIEAGADVNDGIVSPLAAAANKGLTACLKCLLKAGADPNVPDPSGRMPIELAALNGTREDVEILYPVTSCIPTVHDWSIDGIIRHAKSVYMKQAEHSSVRRMAELRSLAVNCMKRNDYFSAAALYSVAMEHDPHDSTLLSNRSLCWHRAGHGQKALLDALACREMRPEWPKACYRQGAALMLLKDYGGACDAFLDAAKLDPLNAEIKAALREALNSLKISRAMRRNAV